MSPDFRIGSTDSGPGPQPTAIVASTGDTLNAPAPALGLNIFNHHCVVSMYGIG